MIKKLIKLSWEEDWPHVMKTAAFFIRMEALIVMRSEVKSLGLIKHSVIFQAKI